MCGASSLQAVSVLGTVAAQDPGRERLRLMTEKYILERLALLCNFSLTLSIDGSKKKLPDPPGASFS